MSAKPCVCESCATRLDVHEVWFTVRGIRCRLCASDVDLVELRPRSPEEQRAVRRAACPDCEREP